MNAILFHSAPSAPASRPFASHEVSLAKGELHRWQNAAGLLIEATDGIVWLTQSDGLGDIVLHPGEGHRITRPGLVLAESLTAHACLTARRQAGTN